MNLTIKVTTNCEIEMSPALGECYGHEGDEHYAALVAVADAIKNGRKVKGGTMISLDTEQGIRALRDEASFRSGSCLDQAQDAWDNSERMMYFAMKRSFDSIVKKCDAMLPKQAPKQVESKQVESTVAPVEREPGPYVTPIVRSNGEQVFSASVVKQGGYSMPLGHLPTYELALARAVAYWAKVK